LEDINIFDIIVMSLVTLLGLKGLFRGFIKESFALIGIVGGVFVASRLSSEVGEIVHQIIPFDNNNTMMLVGFIVALILFWSVAYFVGITLSKMFSLSGLGIFDKLLGFVFGASKVFLLFSIITFAASSIETFKTKINKNLNNSIVYPILRDTGGYIIKLDTTKLQNGLSTHVNSAIETTKSTIKDISINEIKENIKKKTEAIKKKAEDIKKELKE